MIIPSAAKSVISGVTKDISVELYPIEFHAKSSARIMMKFGFTLVDLKLDSVKNSVFAVLVVGTPIFVS
uniref:Uncharacterized protein n=1 Tax=viral metagenome TaxID=1070528 RepID=A0A6C0KFE0_9ZZZZ